MRNMYSIFPGQGSQKIGMGKDFFDNASIAKEMVGEASERLKINVASLLFEENDKLDQTEYAQPAILLVSVIAHTLLKNALSINEKGFLGHSLGEFSALCATGAIEYRDALALVHQRGLFMKQACEGKNAGMMAVLGLEDAQIEELTCNARKEEKSVWAANYNGDGQIVIAGNRDHLSSMESLFKEAGAKKSVLLPMSVASHCPFLESAKEPLSVLLDQWVMDSFSAPIISNVTAKSYGSAKEAKELLIEQLCAPVKYKHSILHVSQEADLFIEYGGNVLKGLNKRITEKPTYSITDMKSLEDVLKLLQ
jgi:[acyl-carrier-protein] S-malonyltransferase